VGSSGSRRGVKVWAAQWVVYLEIYGEFNLWRKRLGIVTKLALSRR
jgi:hypothetical protein